MAKASCPYCNARFESDHEGKKPPKTLPCASCKNEMKMYSIKLDRFGPAGALVVSDRVVEITHGLNYFIGKSLDELTQNVLARNGGIRQVYPF